MTLLLAGIIASLVAQEQEAPRSYTAHEVVERAVERGIENDELKIDAFNFKKYESKEELDDDNTVKKVKETTIYQVFSQNGQAVEQLIEKNGKTVKNGKIEAGLSNPNDINFNEILLDKYEFKISDKIPVYWQNKLNIYVIDFYPKKDLDIGPYADHLLNKLEGSIYIDKYFNTWSIRAGFPPDKELSAAWGLLGKLYSFEFTLKQRSIDGIMVIESIEVKYKYRKLWWTIHERIFRTYIDYERENPLE